MILALLLWLLQQAPVRDGARQNSAVTSASIGGIVTTGGTGAQTPLRRATVSITGTGMLGVRQVATDDSGNFLFDDLAPGRFTLTVEKGGYLKTYVGSRRAGRPPSLPIVIVAGQRINDLAIDVPRGGAIEGSVRDENGAPVATAQATLLRRTMANGRAEFTSVPNMNRAVTDDRGRFRIYGIAPGDYIVQVVGGPAAGGGAQMVADEDIRAVESGLKSSSLAVVKAAPARLVTRALLYAPGVLEMNDAAVITLAAGEERLDVDVTSRLVAAANVGLVITAASGQPLQNVNVGVANLSRQAVSTGFGIIRPNADGRFLYPAMAPGSYRFYGVAGEQGADGSITPVFLSMDLVVDGNDLSNVALTFQRGQTVKGRVSVDAGNMVPRGAHVVLTAVGVIAGTAPIISPGTIAPDGTFAVVGVPQGRYRLSLQGIAGWITASAMHAGRDTLDDALVVMSGVDVDDVAVRITNQPSSVSGIVTDASGRPSPEFTALVFAEARELRMSSPRRMSGLLKIGTDGRFEVKGLPAGDYLLAVVVDADPSQLADEEFLQQIAAGAVKIRLAEGQKLVQDLKIGG